MLHGVVERVCLPAGSTVTHDFAGRRFESRRFARVRTNDGLRQRGICSLTTGGVSIITIPDGNKSLCRLTCRDDLRAARTLRFRRHQAEIRPVWKKARRDRFASLSISGTTWKTHFRSETMTQRQVMNTRQEKYRGKLSSAMYLYSWATVLIDPRFSNRGSRSSMGLRVVAAIASISIVKSAQRENAERPDYNVEGFVRLTGAIGCAGKTASLERARGSEGTLLGCECARDAVGFLDNGGSWESGATISHAFITASGSASGYVDLAYWPY